MPCRLLTHYFRTLLAVLLPLLLLGWSPTDAPAQTTAVPAVLGASGRGALQEIVEEGVLDEANLFRPHTLVAAQEKIRQMKRDYLCGVFVDTISRLPPSVPPADVQRANSWSGRIADAYFHEWAQARAREFGVEGIHILICKQPRHVAVVVWPDRFEPEFGPNQRVSLEKLLRRQLRTTPDDTLLTALDQMDGALRAHRDPGPPSANVWPLGILLGGGAGVWLVLSLVRLRLRKPDPFSFGGELRPIERTTGMLAGMFGTPAAYWVTDRLFPSTVAAGAGSLDPEAERASVTLAPAQEEDPAEAPPAEETEPLPEHAEMKYQ